MTGEGPEEREERGWEEAAGMRARGPIGYDDAVEPDERNWGVVAHLAGFAGYVVPLANLVGPLAVWLYMRDDSDFVEACARESLNFQISVTIYLAVAWALTWVIVGFPLLAAIFVVDVVTIIVAALRASRGEFYRYPFCLRLVS